MGTSELTRTFEGFGAQTTYREATQRPSETRATAEGAPKRILVLNTFGSAAADLYRRAYVGSKDRIAYITTEDLPESIASSSAHVERVSSLARLDEAVMTAAARAMIILGGPIDRVVAMREDQLVLASEMRELLNIDGQKPDDVRRYRDKAEMKRVIRASGIRAPEFAEANDTGEVQALAERRKFRLVFKPKDGFASMGIIMVRNKAEFDDAFSRIKDKLETYEVEELVLGSITHVDGMVVNGRVRYSVPSRYINTPYEYSHANKPVGTVTLDETDPQYARLNAFAAQCVQSMGLTSGAFHLEVIEEEDGSLCFLEMGARVGGGFIGPNMEEVLGNDIFADDARMRAGGTPRERNESPVHKAPVAGFILFPMRLDGQKYKVMRAPSLIGKISGIFDEKIPKVGDILDGDPNRPSIYVINPGTFRVKGKTHAEVNAIIRRIENEYTYELVPVDG